MYVCHVNSEEGIDDNALLVQTHKLFRKTNGEYTTATKNILLSEIQGLNDNFNVERLHRKTPEEMVVEGMKAAEQVWRQKHTASDWNSLSTAETGLDESDSRPELDRFKERVRELTKPLETDVDGMPFEDESVRVNYDHLYDPNYVPSNNVEDAAVRNLKGVPISENSFNAAKEAIDSLAMNSSLMQIINPERSLGSKMIDSKMIINNIRASHLTRCRLFEYLTSRLDRLAAVNPGALADRVLRDSEDNLKSPNYLGGNYYAGKMRSREYTIVLAIAMMDGSFNVDIQDKTVTHYRDGRERSGMHRDSARALLEYVRNNY